MEARQRLVSLLECVKEGEALFFSKTAASTKEYVCNSTLPERCVDEPMVAAEQALREGLDVHEKARRVLLEAAASPAFSFHTLSSMGNIS